MALLHRLGCLPPTPRLPPLRPKVCACCDISTQCDRVPFLHEKLGIACSLRMETSRACDPGDPPSTMAQHEEPACPARRMFRAWVVGMTLAHFYAASSSTLLSFSFLSFNSVTAQSSETARSFGRCKRFVCVLSLIVLIATFFTASANLQSFESVYNPP